MESALYLPVSLYIPRRHRPRPPSATDQIHLCSGMETETEMKETLLPSKLPLELWSEIGKRLESRIDVACFRSVCRLWRSSLARPSRFPIRVPPPPGATSDINGIYLITEIETYNLFERRRMSIEGLDQPGKFRTVGCPPWDVFDVSRRDRYPLHLLAKSYRICFSYPGCCSSKKVSLRDKVFTIVTISSNANGRVAAEYARLSDISLVAHLVTGRLALLRLDNSDSGWDTSFCGNRIFVAIATYNGQLCAIDCFSRVFLMDYHSLQMTQGGIIEKLFIFCNISLWVLKTLCPKPQWKNLVHKIIYRKEIYEPLSCSIARLWFSRSSYFKSLMKRLSKETIFCMLVHCKYQKRSRPC